MTRKKNISDMTQTHGKVDDFKPTTLDQIWGDDGFSRYKTLNEDQYREFLSEMSKTDLRAHSHKVGVVPIDNRETLEKKLMAEFLKHINSYKVPNTKKIQADISSEAINILKEGK